MGDIGETKRIWRLIPEEGEEDEQELVPDSVPETADPQRQEDPVPA